MLAHGVPRESHIFPPSRHHTGHIGPHDKTMDTYASKHQRLLQSCGQEQPSITSIINVSGRDRGSKLYVAPKGNKVHSLAYSLHCTPLTRFRTLMDDLRSTRLVIVQLSPIPKMLHHTLM